MINDSIATIPSSETASNEGSSGSVKMLVLTPAAAELDGFSLTGSPVQDI